MTIRTLDALTACQVAAIEKNIAEYGLTKTKHIVFNSALFTDAECELILDYIEYRKAV